MADIIPPTNPWTPPGGIVTLSTAGQKLRAAPGIAQQVVLGGVFIEGSAVGAEIASTIKLKMPADFAAAGAIQCAASRAQIHCEVDLFAKPMQGLQLIRWPAGAGTPDDVNLDGLYIYNNALGDDPGAVGFNHAIYFQDSVRATGKNMRFTDIRGGRALHFYPNAKDSRITNVTDTRCYGDVVFWGTGVIGNQVAKLLSLNVGAKGVVEWGGGAAPITNTCDYRTTPTPGYGYQPPAPTPDIAAAKLKLVSAQTMIADALRLLG